MTRSPRYWSMPLGPPWHWRSCLDEGHAILTLRKDYPVGDLSQYRTRDALAEAIDPQTHRRNYRKAYWRFAHEIEPGDVIIAKFERGRSPLVFGYGEVVGPYRYDSRRRRHLLPVKWHSDHSPDGLDVGRPFPQRICAERIEESDMVAALKDALHIDDQENSSEDDSHDERSLPEHPRNQVLYGPPGTGKTYATVGHALAAVDCADAGEVAQGDKERYRKLKAEGRVAMVTFHQNYAYEDFVEGIRPKLTAPDDGDDAAESEEAQPPSELEYELKPGIFRRICEAAETERRAAQGEEREPERFVLIIDEINRGNIPKIFGELITLIEDSRRLGADDETTVTLPYSGDEFGVPDNLYIIGTMNTADRSIQQLDTALRRRFTFVEMMPKPSHELIPADVDEVDCREMLRAMNDRIALLMDREHQIGHTYLFNVRDLDDLSDRFRNRIFPLLQEYFYDDWRKIRAVLGGNAFVQERKIGEGYTKNLIHDSDLVDDETIVYERLAESDPSWTDAPQYRQIYESEAAD